MTIEKTSAGAPSSPSVLPPISEPREAGPVARVTMLSGLPGYLVTRYDEARQVLADPVFSRARTLRPGAAETLPRQNVGSSSTLFNLDPPEHTRLRRIVSRAFTRSRVEAMREELQEVVGGLLDRMADAGPPVDLVEALCAPLPMTEICVLLGVPYEDRASFREWSQALMSTQRTSDEAMQARRALHGYLTGLIAAKRERPEDDLLSALLVVRDQEERISESELVTLGITLLIAGHETTMNQLGASVHALLSDPELYDSLHHDPVLIPSAVEELLRLYPAVPLTIPRMATEDVEIGGVRIPAGSMVAVSCAAANRDPSLFHDPGMTDLGRPDNNHMSFGHGPHFCLGVHLARTELRVALSSLTRRFPGLRLAVPPWEVNWRADALIRGPSDLPVTW